MRPQRDRPRLLQGQRSGRRPDRLLDPGARQVGHPRGGHGGHDDVEIVRAQKLVQLAAEVAVDFQIHVRMVAQEGGQRVLQEGHGVVSRQADAQHAGHVRAVEVAHRLIVDPQHLARIGQQRLARRSGVDRPALLRQKRCADQILQPFDLQGNRRLAAAQNSPGPRVAAQFHHGDEGAQKVGRQVRKQRHGFAPSMEALRQSIFIIHPPQRSFWPSSLQVWSHATHHRLRFGTDLARL